jgi:hypothetical protein
LFSVSSFFCSLRIVPQVRERKIFLKAIQVMNLFNKSILTIHRLKACEAIALIAQTEDFVTDPSRYYDMNNAREINALLDLREKVLPELMTDFETKKLLRPLTDMIDKIKRRMASKK